MSNERSLTNDRWCVIYDQRRWGKNLQSVIWVQRFKLSWSEIPSSSKCFGCRKYIASTDLGPKCWAQQKICLVLEVIFITWRKWTEYIFLDWISLLFTGTWTTQIHCSNTRVFPCSGKKSIFLYSWIYFLGQCLW